MWYRTVDGGVLVSVKVIASAPANEVCGVIGGTLKLKVAAAPEKGKANTMVCVLLADYYSVSPTRIKIIRGQTSPRKKVFIPLNPENIRSIH